MEALILAAGRGTRMRGLCTALPKPLLPLANVPVLERILRCLAKAGVEQAWIVVGHGAEAIRRQFATGECDGLRIGFIEQATPDGTGSATLLGKPHLRPESFLLLFADIIVACDEYARLLAAHRATKCDAMLTVRRVPDPCAGAAVYVEASRVVRIVEKPPPGTSNTPYDNAGLFIMPPTLFDFLARIGRSPRGEYELTDAISAMLAAGIHYAAYEISGFWFNLTGPEALVAANAHLITEAQTSQVLPPQVTIAPPVTLGRKCHLTRCRLGPNVSVGDGCVVGEDAVIEHAILMRGVRVGRGAQIRYAILSEGTSVAPGEHVLGEPLQVVTRT